MGNCYTRGMEMRSKGFSYSLESLLVIGLILSAMIILFSGVSPSGSSRNLKPLGADALQSLDEEGILREYVVTNQTTLLETEISSILPQTIDFKLVICSESCPAVSLPRNKNVIANFYYVSGTPGVYAPYEIILYTWEK